MSSLTQRVPFQQSKLFVRKLNPIIPVFGFFGLPAVFQDGILCCSVFAIEVFCSVISLVKITAFLDNIGISLPGINSTDGLTDGLALGEAETLLAEGDGEADLPPAEGEADGETDLKTLSADGDALPAVDDGLALGEAEGEALPAIDGLALGDSEAEGLSDGDPLGDSEAEGLSDGLTEGDTDAEGDSDALGD